MGRLFWTRARLETLAGLFFDGLTARQAAARMGVALRSVQWACWNYRISINVLRRAGRKYAAVKAALPKPKPKPKRPRKLPKPRKLQGPVALYHQPRTKAPKGIWRV